MNRAQEEVDMSLDSFAMHSLRDVADQDYITARLCYRNNLMLQFYWSALQAVEKYFKAIMLFHRISSTGREFGHDIIALYSCVAEIEGLDFSLSNDQLKFLKDINDAGENRYMTLPFKYGEYNVIFLDNLIWSIRGYCRAELSNRFSAEQREREVALIKAKLNARGDMTLPGGHLERELSDKDSVQRTALIWKNPYFGRKLKRISLKAFNGRVLPVQHLNPEIIERLFELVHFPKAEKQHLRRYRDRMRSASRSRR